MFDKFFQRKPRPTDCYGDCATVENGLLYLHKKVPEGEDPNRDKYTAGHYLKNFSEYRVLSNGDTIIRPKAKEQGRHEVAVLEFLRLMIPGQPKARFVQDKNSNYYLDSKEVKSVGSLQPLYLARSVSEYLGQTEMVKDLYHKLNWEVYGSEQGFKRLGELNFIMHGVLHDIDRSGHNYLFDAEYNLYRIDGELTGWEGYNFSLLWNSNEEFLATEDLRLKNQVYIKERNQILLKFLILPPEIIKAFCNSYFLEDLRDKRAIQLIEAQKHIKENLIKDYVHIVSPTSYFPHSNSRHLFPEFGTYITSDEAQAYVLNYVDYVEQFKISGKKRLVEQCTVDWKKAMTVSHANLIKELAYYKIVTSINTKGQSETLTTNRTVTSDPIDENSHDRTITPPPSQTHNPLFILAILAKPSTKYVAAILLLGSLGLLGLGSLSLTYAGFGALIGLSLFAGHVLSYRATHNSPNSTENASNIIRNG